MFENEKEICCEDCKNFTVLMGNPVCIKKHPLILVSSTSKSGIYPKWGKCDGYDKED